VNYLTELNDAQQQAAKHIEGPMMVIAGAGSGKTRVLTYRIAHLIHSGVDPFSILSLTFTNKAAREMKERISTIIGDKESANIWMGTFHSVFARVLRTESDRINYPKNFTIYDTQDSRSVIKDVISELNLDDKVYKPASVQARISGAKNNLISPEEYRRSPDLTNEDIQAQRPMMADIYAAYNRKCYRAGAMDFDDLLFKTNELLRDFPDVLHYYQHKFQFILVDEYQDTNFSQYLIIKQLAALRENICVVGDDAQSIYAFRGANIQNILNFRRDYPEFAMYKLEQNYRSTKTIVNAANSIISKNKDQIQKTVWTDNEKGDYITLQRSLSDNDEGRYVANDIFETRMTRQAAFKDFAILYRTNAQSRSFEEALRKLNMPYRIYGGQSFYQRKEIKDLLAYFRLSANHNDDESLKRIINYPARGIGKTTVEKLIIASAKFDVPIWEVIQQPNTYPSELPSATMRKVMDFCTMIKSFTSQIETHNAFDLGHHIAQSSGLLKELHTDKTPEGVARYDNIQEILNGMKEFSDDVDPDNPEAVRTMTDFMIDIALLTDADKDDGDNDKISMMTVHAAKGLEFNYVYIVGLEENLFPSQMALHSREELEEERRLFYVALTRAKQRAVLSYAITRYRWGQLSQCEPSRFIEEIDQEYINVAAMVLPKQEPARSWNNERSNFFKGATSTAPRGNKPLTRLNTATQDDNQEVEEIAEGMEVEHARFGKGKVLKVEGKLPNTKATVYFPSAGQKELLVKFAKLKVL
jgi:DNA helicase-2/ATP-dependent DNA helicase PcrA